MNDALLARYRAGKGEGADPGWQDAFREMALLLLEDPGSLVDWLGNELAARRSWIRVGLPPHKQQATFAGLAFFQQRLRDLETSGPYRCGQVSSGGDGTWRLYRVDGEALPAWDLERVPVTALHCRDAVRRLNAGVTPGQLPRYTHLALGQIVAVGPAGLTYTLMDAESGTIPADAVFLDEPIEVERV
jgi:hypothetical protein